MSVACVGNANPTLFITKYIMASTIIPTSIYSENDFHILVIFSSTASECAHIHEAYGVYFIEIYIPSYLSYNVGNQLTLKTTHVHTRL